MQCKISDERLYEWLDGELPASMSKAEQEELERHLQKDGQRCEHCRERIEQWGTASRELRGLIDAGIGDPEPLLAVQRIHEEIAARARGPWTEKAGDWLEDARLTQSPGGLSGQLVRSRGPAMKLRTMAGLAAAAVLAIVSGPALVHMLDDDLRAPETLVASRDTYTSASPMVASVVIESLEFDGRSRAVVYQPASDTTVIWVDREGRIDVGEF